MNRSFFFKAASVATFAVTTLTAATAHAQFANNLNVVGQLRFTSTSMTGFPLTVDFLSGANFPPGMTGSGQPGNVFTGFADGAFAGVTGNTNGTIQDLLVGSNGASPTTNPAAGAATFMLVDGYTFTLGAAPAGFGPGTFTLADRAGGADATFSVFGTVSGPGFTTPTSYQGLFTAQFAGQTAASVLSQAGNGGTRIVTFSANFGAPVGPTSTVPEPSTYALMAAGLGGLGFAVRRRRAQA